jgi:hypothetical protein
VKIAKWIEAANLCDPEGTQQSDCAGRAHGPGAASWTPAWHHTRP